jgi:hypothetical protein
MRCLTLLLIGGLVLAVSSQAWAITLVVGENDFKIINRDNGTVYSIAGGAGTGIGDKNNVANGVALLDAYVSKTPAVGGLLGGSEDSWGIANTSTIHDSGGNIIWQAGGATELTWMFHSAKDFYAQTVNASGTTVTTQSVGLVAELWEEPLAGGTHIDMTQGSPWRTGLSTYTGATEGTMLLQLTSVAGFIHEPGELGGALTEFETTFNSFGNSGGGVAYFNVTGGTMMAFFDTNTIYTEASLYNKVANADAWIQFTSTPASDGPNGSKNPLHVPPYDWLVQSEDPVRTDVAIPEPVTMAGLLLGIGCLGRYIRKRR